MRDNGSRCKVTVDGTDCPIYEPTPFHKGWYSHKFKGPGARYEVAVCIQTGWIVWVNGPYPCGEWPDLKIARGNIMRMMLPGEMFLADGGYRDGHIMADTPTGINNDEQYMKQCARARHETINKRLKQFLILSHKFRYPLHKHATVFFAVANITQMIIEKEGAPFQVEYKDN